MVEFDEFSSNRRILKKSVGKFSDKFSDFPKRFPIFQRVFRTYLSIFLPTANWKLYGQLLLPPRKKR